MAIIADVSYATGSHSGRLEAITVEVHMPLQIIQEG